MDWELCAKHLICGYIPAAAALTLLFILLNSTGKKRTPGHILVSFVFCFYLVGILTMTGIWYLGSFAPRIVLIPFLDMIRSPLQTALNVLLFIPLGLFLPLLYRNCERIGKVLLVGFLVSLSVEALQMFGCGTSDVNDLITNTIGAGLGFALWKLLCVVIPGSRLKTIRIEGAQTRAELILLCAISLAAMLTVQPLLYHAWFSAASPDKIRMWEASF